MYGTFGVRRAVARFEEVQALIVRQHLIRALRIVMPLLMLGTVGATIGLAVLNDGRFRYPAIIAAGSALAVLVISLTVHSPIDTGVLPSLRLRLVKPLAQPKRNHQQVLFALGTGNGQSRPPTATLSGAARLEPLGIGLWAPFLEIEFKNKRHLTSGRDPVCLRLHVPVDLAVKARQPVLRESCQSGDG